jgi:pimeloyl-ACP methyl ester carboxylesterase
VSTPRTLGLPDRVRRVEVRTSRGSFAALEAIPGSGVCERKPALLVPGYTGSKEDFLAVLQPLAAAGRRVVTIDMRGQYETPGPADHGAYAPDQLAADIAGLAATVGPDGGGVHLLGHSLGGLVARHTVLAQTASISSLTLLGSGPGSLRGQRATRLRAVLADLGKAGPAQRARRVRELWEAELGPQAAVDGVPAPIIAFLRERMLRNSAEGLIAMGTYLLSCPDHTAALAGLGSLPILVLYGENDDAWPPAVQDRMARRLGAQRVCIPAAAHSPAVEAPETTASTLTMFWNAAECSERRRKAAGQGAAQPGADSLASDGISGGVPGNGVSGNGAASSAAARPSQGRRGSAAAVPSGHRPR